MNKYQKLESFTLQAIIQRKMEQITTLDPKLDGVGHVDNRPSTDKLHHFVKKKKMWHLTCDT